MADLNNNDVQEVALTPVEQAAIVLLSIGEEPAAAVLRCLEREELIELTQVMSRMSGIKVDAVKNAIQKFFDDYRQQSGLHGASRSYLKRSLDLALGSDIANSVLNTIYGDAIRPMMARLQYASPKWLAEYIAAEHVQMQAVFLAFLPPALAGQIIDALPLEGRDLVLLNLARLDEIDRDLLAELEELVQRCLSALDTQSASRGRRAPGRRDPEPPAEQPRRQMVELLRAHDPEVVSQIEMSMYDFFILSNQTEQVITRLLDESRWSSGPIALKGAEPIPARRHPGRHAEAPGAELRGPDAPFRPGADVAHRADPPEIMATVKALADAGEIEVQLFAEATAE
jgi:flagellar motor switch protein FliG